ncbi:hypothetical protein ACFQ2M_24925 [Kitasatospora saccharophila]|uniref:hypothetical protein n=1 Tax=Kitasatospora saccharophila TaxID=407973 RepID=UPI00362821E2
MVEPACFGLTLSRYASCPATRSVPPTVTSVVAEDSARKRPATSCGVKESIPEGRSCPAAAGAV